MFKRKRPLGEYYHCTECRKDLVGNEFQKILAGHEVVDGKLVPNQKRFSVFCTVCRSFLGFVDQTISASINKSL